MKLLKSIFLSLISTGSTEECVPAGLPEKYREHYRIIENTGTCYIEKSVMILIPILKAKIASTT